MFVAVCVFYSVDDALYIPQALHIRRWFFFFVCFFSLVYSWLFRFTNTHNKYHQNHHKSGLCQLNGVTNFNLINLFFHISFSHSPHSFHKLTASRIIGANKKVFVAFSTSGKSKGFSVNQLKLYFHVCSDYFDDQP